MATETVRYPDALVERIEAFVTAVSAVESKSEYHRFASEYRRSLLNPEHEAALDVVDAAYDVTDREALLLDELVGQAPTHARRLGRPIDARPPGEASVESDA